MKSANKQIAVTAIILIFLLTSLFAYADDKLVLPKKLVTGKYPMMSRYMKGTTSTSTLMAELSFITNMAFST